MPETTRDLVSEATGGLLHDSDPNMDDFERGWEEFELGLRAEVRLEDGSWQKGTIVETLLINDRAIVVECDEPFHHNLDFYQGCGATIMVFHNTRRGILRNIRLIDEPARKVNIPDPKPQPLEGIAAELLEIAEATVAISNGRLRIAFAEKDDSRDREYGSARCIKLDEHRLGRDLELYAFMSNVGGWENALAYYYEETVLPLRGILSDSYQVAVERLQPLGLRTIREELHQAWKAIFDDHLTPN